MPEERLEELGEKSLQYEKELIEKILLAKMMGQDATQELEELKVTSQLSDLFIRLFIAKKGEVTELCSLFGKAVERCQEQIQLATDKTKLEKDYSIEDDISYRIEKISYYLQYVLDEERVKRLLFYYESEENKPNPKEMVRQFLQWEYNILPIRNYLIGKTVDCRIQETDVEVMANRDFLALMTQMSLTHHQFNWASVLIMTLGNTEDREEYRDADNIIPAAFLNFIITLSVARDLEKQFAAKMEMFDNLPEDMMKSIIKLPAIEEHPEILSEIEHILESIESFSEKYHNQDQK